jgi:hypothetical protein
LLGRRLIGQGSPSSSGGVLVARQTRNDSLEEMLRRVGNLIYRPVEGFLVGRGRFPVAADLAYELESRRANLLVANDLVPIPKSNNASTHGKKITLLAKYAGYFDLSDKYRTLD